MPPLFEDFLCFIFLYVSPGDGGIKSLEFSHFYILAGTSDDYPDGMAFEEIIRHWPWVLDLAGLSEKPSI